MIFFSEINNVKLPEMWLSFVLKNKGGLCTINREGQRNFSKPQGWILQFSHLPFLAFINKSLNKCV